MDRPGLDQVRERVLQTARDVELLCQSRVPPHKLFPQFVKLVSSALGAQGAAVWMRNEQRQLVQLHAAGESFGIDADQKLREWHQQLLGNTLATGETGAESPRASNGQAPPALTVALAPLHSGRECVGAVELYYRGEQRPDARVAGLQFLEQMCGFASRYLTGSQESGPEAWAKFLEDFEALSLRLHRGLDWESIGATAVNDGRALFGCQRVSLAIQRGRRLKVTSISGQEGVNRRSNLVRAMGALMKKTAAGREPLFFAGEPETVPVPLRAPLTKYLEENGSQVVAVVPLLEHPAPLTSDDDKPGRLREEKPRTVVGCLVVDGPLEARLSDRSRDAIHLLADHTAAAVANALTYRRIFLMPLWRFLGNRWDRFRGWTMVTVLTIVALVAALIAAMILLPWDYRVPAEGRLMPVVQRQVFAPWDGDVVEIAVRDGQRVKAGDRLLTLHSGEMRQQLLATRNELNNKREQILALQARIDEATKKADRDEETRLQGELGGTRIEIDGLERQLNLWEQRLEQLVVRSPIAGVVATFRVEQLLLNRPVKRGDVLMEVMDDDGAWRLELDVPEHRMGHVLRARKNLPEPNRPVEYVLATTPELTFNGQLESIATRTQTSDKEGSIVEAHVNVDASRLPARNIGAEVRARIDCGKRSLGYVLFGDFIEWVRKTLWL